MGNCSGIVSSETHQGVSAPEEYTNSSGALPSGDRYVPSSHHTSNASASVGHHVPNHASNASSSVGHHFPKPLKSNLSSRSVMGEVLNRPMEDVKMTYTMGRELGRGQFGITYLCTHKATGEKVQWDDILLFSLCLSFEGLLAAPLFLPLRLPHVRCLLII